MHNVERGNALSRFVAQEKFELWPQAALHTHGRAAVSRTIRRRCNLPQADAGDRRFASQQSWSRCATGVLERFGPATLLTGS